MKHPTTRLRFAAEFNPSPPSSVRGSTSEFPLYPMEAIHEFGAPSEPALRPVDDLLSGYSYVEPTDVAYAKVTPCFENGKGLVGSELKGPAFATTELTVLRPRPGVSRDYLAWLLQSDTFRAPAISSMTGAGGLRRVAEPFVRDLEVPLPGLERQHAIVDYLDHEAAEIDSLVEELATFHDIVTERTESTQSTLLQRLSSENGSRRLKFLADVTVGIVVRPADLYVESDGVPALRGVNIQPDTLVLDDLVQISHSGHLENSKSRLRAGDIVVVRTGKAGTAAMVPAGLDNSNAIDLLIIRPGAALDGGFLTSFLNSQETREVISVQSVGAIQGHYNVQTLSELAIVCPPIDEQRRVRSELLAIRESSDRVLSDLTRAIALAKERRAALITAAVSGQIDVTAKHRPAAEQLEDDIKELS